MSLFKKVGKAVSNVAKVAIAPITVAAASSLNSVGLRGAANKVVKATEGKGKLAKAVSKVSTVGGYAIDAGALAIGGAAAAPYLSGAATAVGHGVAAGGALLKGGAGHLLGAFTSKKGNPNTGTADTPVDATSELTNFVNKGKTILHKNPGFSNAVRKAVGLPVSGTDADALASGANGGVAPSGQLQAGLLGGGSMPTWLLIVGAVGTFILLFISGRGKD